MEAISQYHVRSECVKEIQTFLMVNNKASDETSLDLLIKEALNYRREISKELEDLLEEGKNVRDTRGQHKLIMLQKLFNACNISVKFIDCLDNSKPPSIIGDHTVLILDLIPKIQEIINLTEDEKDILFRLRKIVTAILSKQPIEDDLNLFIEAGSTIIRNFVSLFKLTAWNYCHLLTTHMTDDAEILRKMNASLAMVNISYIESMGSRLKRILKYHTNHNTSSKYEHCLIQAIRYFQWNKDCVRTI